MELSSPQEQGGMSGWRRGRRWWVVLLVVAVLLTLFTVYDQFFHRTGIEFLTHDQIERHQDVLAGRSINPWQYRVLPHIFLAPIIRVGKALALPNIELIAFGVLRVLQNILIFIVASLYWNRLGIRRILTLFMLPVMAWGFSYAGYASGLAFDTYFDLLFYMLGGILILMRADRWLIALMVVAGLNRETSALLPILLLAARLELRPRLRLPRESLWIAGLCMLFFGIEFFGLRLFFGARPEMEPHGVQTGLDLLWFNIRERRTYFFLLATQSYFPWLALLGWKAWLPILQRFFWALVPLWIGVHLFLGVLAEARLLLVPYALVLLPAAFWLLQRELLSSSRLEAGR